MKSQSFGDWESFAVGFSHHLRRLQSFHRLFQRGGLLSTWKSKYFSIPQSDSSESTFHPLASPFSLLNLVSLNLPIPVCWIHHPEHLGLRVVWSLVAWSALPHLSTDPFVSFQPSRSFEWDLLQPFVFQSILQMSCRGREEEQRHLPLSPGSQEPWTLEQRLSELTLLISQTQ